MKKNEIEYWALSIIERVNKRQPVEDDRVELKSTWIEPAHAARRIAGHANAARGEDILWLIGVDEKDGVKGVDYKDYAKWFSTVASQFDENLAPEGIFVNVPYEGSTVLAILFETDRAPYVVKNPSGGSIQFEVPWRSNTSTKTANRGQLLQILLPPQNIPKIELLSGQLTRQGAEEWHWNLRMELYVSSNIKAPLVIPFHQCEAFLEFGQSFLLVPLKNIKLAPPPLQTGGGYRMVNNSALSPAQRPEHDSITIDGTSSEIMIKGAGKFLFSGSGETPPIEDSILEDLIKFKAKLQPIDTDRFIHLDFPLNWAKPKDKESNQNRFSSLEI